MVLSTKQKTIQYNHSLIILVFFFLHQASVICVQKEEKQKEKDNLIPKNLLSKTLPDQTCTQLRETRQSWPHSKTRTPMMVAVTILSGTVMAMVKVWLDAGNLGPQLSRLSRVLYLAVCHVQPPHNDQGVTCLTQYQQQWLNWQ